MEMVDLCGEYLVLNPLGYVLYIIPVNITILSLVSASCGMALSVHDSTVPLC